MIPPKIIINNNIENISDIKEKIDNFFINLDLYSKEEKERSTHKSENNK